MKITDIESVILRLPVVKPIGDGCQTVLIIKVHTAEGITGLGECHANPEVGKAIIDARLHSISSCGLKELLIGEDPRDINRLWDLMYRRTQSWGRRGAVMYAISGVEMALWDILGKSLNAPVHRLLGGARKMDFKVYASDLAPDKPGGSVKIATKHRRNGYQAVKIGWGGLGGDPRADVKMARDVRRAVGPDMDIMIDMGFPVPLSDALYLGEALAEHGVYFLEEPLHSDDLHGYRRLTEASRTPIATGEKDTTQYPFIDLMERGGLRIVQPDLARVGGITEMMRIATHAEARGVRVIPHCWSTDILVAATLHFISTLRDCPYLEFNATDNPLRTQLLKEPIRPDKHGVVRVPDKPGLGIELDERTMKKYRFEP
ncbi:MAG: mandelate racemase/muconate lactonizing enzyme family protein [Alphaproteobacteria bacterium]|nr:mandelate racemase/muconate lactonizing enzyme family protein [Alphaproteobacteria bacterium]